MKDYNTKCLCSLDKAESITKNNRDSGFKGRSDTNGTEEIGYGNGSL